MNFLSPCLNQTEVPFVLPPSSKGREHEEALNQRRNAPLVPLTSPQGSHLLLLSPLLISNLISSPPVLSSCLLSCLVCSPSVPSLHLLSYLLTSCPISSFLIFWKGHFKIIVLFHSGVHKNYRLLAHQFAAEDEGTFFHPFI